MAAVTGAELLTAVAARLKKASASDLPAYWTAVCDDASATAASEVSGRLQRRGYSAAQVTAADQYNQLTRRLGLYFALLDGLSGEDGFNPATIQPLDIRGQLKTITLLASGVIVTPGDPAGAVVGTGSPVGTGQLAAFVWPPDDGCDEPDGSPTRW